MFTPEVSSLPKIDSSSLANVKNTDSSSWNGREVESVFETVENAISSTFSQATQKLSDASVSEVPVKISEAIKITQLPIVILKIINDYSFVSLEVLMNDYIKKNIPIPNELLEYAENVKSVNLFGLRLDIKQKSQLLSYCKNIESLETDLFAMIADAFNKIAELENIKTLLIRSQIIDNTLDKVTSKRKLQSLNLTNRPDFSKPKFIRERGFTITDTGISYLLRCKDLHTFSITESKMTNDGFKMLTQLPALKELDIICNRNITSEGLLNITSCENLEYFGLRDYEGNTKEALYYISMLPKINSLYLCGKFHGTYADGTSVTDPLSDCKTITWLNFNGCGNFSKADIENISKMTELENLGFFDCKLEESSLKLLCNLKKLKTLVIPKDFLNSADIESIKKENPDLVITTRAPMKFHP